VGAPILELGASKSINTHAQSVQEALGTLSIACLDFVTVPPWTAGPINGGRSYQSDESFFRIDGGSVPCVRMGIGPGAWHVSCSARRLASNTRR